MLLDGRNLPDNKNIKTDVCIVGAGASGITLAREFINAPFNVVLVESGGLKFRHKTQWLYRGENVGRPYDDIEYTKQRYFGGASNKWAGRCRPLDAIDFEERPWVPHSGWPFGKDTLDPFYARAHSVCQLGPYNYDPGFWEDSDKKALSLAGAGIETKIFQFSPPTRFGKEYLDTITSAKNIRTILFANAVSVSLDKDGRKVNNIKFATFNSRSFKAKAKIFILAASALEITRLLLISNDVHAGGIGNHLDLVGRFFMEHPHIYTGVLNHPLPQENTRYYKVLDYTSGESTLGTVGSLGITKHTMKRDRLLNATAFFVRRKDYNTDNSYFSRETLALTHVMDTFNHTRAPGLIFFRDLMTAVRHGNTTLKFMAKRLTGLIHSITWVTLRSQFETVPNPSSRVTLSEKKDSLGMNKIELDWRLTQQDLDSFRKFQKILLSDLQSRGYAVRPFEHELDETGWPVTMSAGKHHMGTTRMHADPKRGVVDPDCRVHGVSNLYIAGSSVFPTSGQANPMLTIVALAIRLADHIKSSMDSKELTVNG